MIRWSHCPFFLFSSSDTFLTEQVFLQMTQLLLVIFILSIRIIINSTLNSKVICIRVFSKEKQRKRETHKTAVVQMYVL